MCPRCGQEQDLLTSIDLTSISLREFYCHHCKSYETIETNGDAVHSVWSDIRD